MIKEETVRLRFSEREKDMIRELAKIDCAGVDCEDCDCKTARYSTCLKDIAVEVANTICGIPI